MISICVKIWLRKKWRSPGDETLYPATRDPLVRYATTCVTKRIARDHLKALKQKAKRPANCPNMVMPQVNPAIWRELDRFPKVRDVHMQSTQELLIRGLQLALAMKERLSLLEESKVDGGRQCHVHDSLFYALLGNASLEMSFWRRELLKPSVNRRYHSLCGPSTDDGIYLFGDRMSEDMREIAEATKVSRGIVASNHCHGGVNNASSRHYSGLAGHPQTHGPQRSAARSFNWGDRHGPYHQHTPYKKSYGSHNRPYPRKSVPHATASTSVTDQPRGRSA